MSTEIKKTFSYSSEEEYLNKFTPRKLENAIKIALDTRKFEIELYWKRATYFWAFMIAIYSAYFLISTRQNNPDWLLLSIISVLGICFSFGWYIANRGSKYWQENWEAHIGILVTQTSGPVFKYKLKPEHKFLNLIKNYPISVSKVNQILSIINFIIWFLLFIKSLFLDEEFKPLKDKILQFITIEINNPQTIIVILIVKIIAIIALVIGVLYIIFRFSKNEIADNMNEHLSDINKDKPLINKK